MDIGTYVHNNNTDNRLHTFENVPERDDIQSSFFDDLEEKQVMNEVVESNNQAGIGSHLTAY